MSLELSSAPASEPVSRDEFKAWANITHTADDTLVDLLVKAARVTAENWTGRSFITQTWKDRRDCFPCSRTIELERAPLATLTSIAYIDNAGATQTLSSAAYTVDKYSSPPRVVLHDGESWPMTDNVPNAVTIEYVAGYGNAAAVPEGLKFAIKFLAAHWYANRESVVVAPGITPKEIPHTIELLLFPYRVFM